MPKAGCTRIDAGLEWATPWLLPGYACRSACSTVCRARAAKASILAVAVNCPAEFVAGSQRRQNGQFRLHLYKLGPCHPIAARKA